MTRSRPSRRRRATEIRTSAEMRAPTILRKLSTFNVLSEAGLEQIEANADTILAETGMEFQDDPEILKIFADAGCDVNGTRVRFAPGFCRKMITATAPAQFTQHARNPANSVQLGGEASVLCPAWGPDLERRDSG